MPPDPPDTPSPPERLRGPEHEAFFGRRKGKPLKSEQERLIGERLSALRVDPTALPADLRELFPIPLDEVRLEIGFGGAEHMLAAAEREPTVGFIGAEPFINGIGKALVGMDARGLTNIRLYDDDVRPLLDRLPAASLSIVYLYYPDPWRKRRHWKRRFLVDENVARLARVLRPGGLLRFATDWENYAAWGLSHVRRSPAFRWTARGPQDWLEPWPDWLRTRYEAKAIREGRVPSYLEFLRV
jgi:tRNA (guanine-N7-)-methyltransferase